MASLAASFAPASSAVAADNTKYVQTHMCLVPVGQGFTTTVTSTSACSEIVIQNVSDEYLRVTPAWNQGITGNADKCFVVAPQGSYSLNAAHGLGQNSGEIKPFTGCTVVAVTFPAVTNNANSLPVKSITTAAPFIVTFGHAG